jgi:tetratricopeptide (TPR) repeat protein/CheY-like chemotaxis protein
VGRILVIEPDTRISQALARLLRGSGQTAELVADEMAALATLMERPADLVLAAAGPGAALARRTWSALATLDPEPTIVWTGPIRAMALPLLEAGRGEDFLETPPAAPALQSLLARIVGVPASADRWSGRDFLARIDGEAARFPPARVLFLAHRVSGTGVLSVTSGDVAWTVALKKGRIAGCTGLADLHAADGPAPSASAPPLMAALGRAIGMGADPDTAMHAAGVGIARAALRATELPDATVRFVTAEPQGGAVQLPTSIPRLLAEAAGRERPPAAVRSALGSRRKAPVRVQVPGDAPESQWGLPPVALRLLRDGTRVETLGELLGAARGGETDEVWAAVDLLACLGLLSIGEGGGGTGRVVAPPEDDIEIEIIAEPPAAAPAPAPAAQAGPELDEEGAALKAWFDGVVGEKPWVVLGIEDSEEMTADGVESAFRKQSANFHPDRYLSASKMTQAVAKRCFARLVEAKEALSDVDVLLEARQRMRAAEEGRPYASPAEQQQARLIAKRADVAARKKQWAEAHRLWTEACEVDPTEVSYQWFHLETGWRSGEIPGAEAEPAMLALKSMKLGHRANLMAIVGEIRLRAGDEAGAYEAFAKAVEMNPDHVDARRRIRLRDMRQAKAEPQKGRGLSSLRGLFSFGKKGGGDPGAGESGG